MNKYEQTRRQFLRTASMASMAGITASPFLLELNSVVAMAQQSNPTDYRALVCVFLSGGNDGHGMVIATDSASFSAFTAARSGAPGLAYNPSDSSADRVEHAPERPDVRTEPLPGRGAESLQCRARGDHRQHGHFSCSNHQGADPGELGAATGLAILAFRPDGCVAGNYGQRRKRGAHRLGRRHG